MRPWIYRLARELGVSGAVCNETSGVTIEAFADRDTLTAFLRALRVDTPPAAVIDAVGWTEIRRPVHRRLHHCREPRRRRPLRLHSARPGTCHTLRRGDPGSANRRSRYPFTNCTNCGPRFTIATGCHDGRRRRWRRSACAGVPARIRRSHRPAISRAAQRVPGCGPALRVLDGTGQPISVEDPIRLRRGRLPKAASWRSRARRVPSGLRRDLVRCGGAVARAQAPRREAVRRHGGADRNRRRRSCRFGRRGAAESVERPIVIARALTPARRSSRPSRPAQPVVGVMLPYTPLHHLLLPMPAARW